MVTNLSYNKGQLASLCPGSKGVDGRRDLASKLQQATCETRTNGRMWAPITLNTYTRRQSLVWGTHPTLQLPGQHPMAASYLYSTVLGTIRGHILLVYHK